MADRARPDALPRSGGVHGGAGGGHSGGGHAPNSSGWSSIRPIYTAGTSAKDADLLDARFPVFKTGRGGQFTYHGPGQRVGYVMLDLKRRGSDVRAYVHALEDWLIRTLAALGREGRAARRPRRYLGGARL